LNEYTLIANFVYNTYVAPAFLDGAEKVTIRVHEVMRGLQSRFGLVAIHRVLGSEKFRASLSLPSQGGRGRVVGESHLPSEYEFDLKPLLSQRSIRHGVAVGQLEAERAGKGRAGEVGSGGSKASAPADTPGEMRAE
jgi:hypothetical protein